MELSEDLWVHSGWDEQLTSIYDEIIIDGENYHGQANITYRSQVIVSDGQENN